MSDEPPSAPRHGDDWFRSAAWDEAAQETFSQRLGRARPTSRVQYRRIKAIALLRSGDVGREAAGRDLLELNLGSDQAYDHEKVLAHVLLAEIARHRGRLDDAERHLRDALRIGGPNSSGRNGEEEVQLAEILLEKGGSARIAEAKALLDGAAAATPALFVRSRHRLYVTQARAYVALGDRSAAATWASAALRAAETEHSGLKHHPTLGLVESAPELEAWLRELASKDS